MLCDAAAVDLRSGDIGQVRDQLTSGGTGEDTCRPRSGSPSFKPSDTTFDPPVATRIFGGGDGPLVELQPPP